MDRAAPTVQQIEADPVAFAARATLRGELDAAGLATELADLERAGVA